MDEPHDLLYRLIVHELTHQFEYDMIPTSLVRRAVPLWVNEGLSDYMTGVWTPQDLMSVRDAAIADIIPKMTKLEGSSELGGRMVYNLGHAVFEFIEAEVGQGRHPSVSLQPAQGGDRRRRRSLRGIVSDQRRRIRSAVRQVPEGSLQAVPRQGAPGRLRPQPRARSGTHALPERLLRRAVAVRGSCSPSPPATAPIARWTSCSCRRRTARILDGI